MARGFLCKAGLLAGISGLAAASAPASLQAPQQQPQFNLAGWAGSVGQALTSYRESAGAVSHRLVIPAELAEGFATAALLTAAASGQLQALARKPQVSTEPALSASRSFKELSMAFDTIHLDLQDGELSARGFEDGAGAYLAFAAGFATLEREVDDRSARAAELLVGLSEAFHGISMLADRGRSLRARQFALDLTLSLGDRHSALADALLPRNSGRPTPGPCAVGYYYESETHKTTAYVATGVCTPWSGWFLGRGRWCRVCRYTATTVTTTLVGCFSYETFSWQIPGPDNSSTTTTANVGIRECVWNWNKPPLTKPAPPVPPRYQRLSSAPPPGGFTSVVARGTTSLGTR